MKIRTPGKGFLQAFYIIRYPFFIVEVKRRTVNGSNLPDQLFAEGQLLFTHSENPFPFVGRNINFND